MPRRKGKAQTGPIRCTPSLNAGTAQCLSDLREIWDLDSDSAVIARALHECRWRKEILVLEANKAIVRLAKEPASQEGFQQLVSLTEFLRLLQTQGPGQAPPTQS